MEAIYNLEPKHHGGAENHVAIEKARNPKREGLESLEKRCVAVVKLFIDKFPKQL